MKIAIGIVLAIVAGATLNWSGNRTVLKQGPVAYLHPYKEAYYEFNAMSHETTNRYCLRMRTNPEAFRESLVARYPRTMAYKKYGEAGYYLHLSADEYAGIILAACDAHLNGLEPGERKEQA